MPHLRIVLPLLLALLACSGGAPQTHDAIQAAIHKHLASRGDLDMSEMGVKVDSVRYKDGAAEADVTIGAEGNESAQMQMRYTLHDENGAWVVQKPDPAGAGAHGGGQSPSSALPEGHPPTGSSPSGGELPAGHPPVSESGASNPGQAQSGL